RYVYDVATHIPKDEFESVVVCGKGHGKSEGELVTLLKDAGIRTIVLPELTRDVSFGDWFAFLALLKTIREEKPDVLHLNSSKAGGLGSLAGRIARVPNIIFTAHGWAFRESRNAISRVLIWLASILTLLLSHRVIC